MFTKAQRSRRDNFEHYGRQSIQIAQKDDIKPSMEQQVPICLIKSAVYWNCTVIRDPNAAITCIFYASQNLSCIRAVQSSTKLMGYGKIERNIEHLMHMHRSKYSSQLYFFPL